MSDLRLSSPSNRRALRSFSSFVKKKKKQQYSEITGLTLDNEVGEEERSEDEQEPNHPAVITISMDNEEDDLRWKLQEEQERVTQKVQEEERLERLLAAKRKYNRLQTFAYCACYFALGLAQNAFTPALSSLEAKTDSTEDKFAIVLASRGIGWIIGSVIAGKAYERIKGNRILYIVLLVTAGMNFLIPLISNVWVLAALTAICGSFMSPIEVGVNTLTIWIWKEDVGPYMQLLHFAYGAGMGCSSLLFGVVVKIFPESVVLGAFFWLVGIIVALIAIPVFKLKSPPPEKDFNEAQAHAHHGGSEESELSKMDLVDEERAAKAHKTRFFIIVPLVAGFLLLYGGAENTYSVWVAPYTEKVYELGKDDAAFVDAMFFATLTVGRFISVPLATRLSSRILLLSAMLVCIVALVVGIMFESFHSAVLLYIVVSLTGLAMAPMFAAAFTIPAELRLKGKLSTASSVFIVVSGIGDMAFPAGAGVFLGAFGIDALMWLILILFCICFALYLVAYTYGLSTIEKRLPELELRELSDLEEYWN